MPQRLRLWRRYGRTRYLRLFWFFACDSCFAIPQRTDLRLWRRDLQLLLCCRFCRCWNIPALGSLRQRPVEQQPDPGLHWTASGDSPSPLSGWLLQPFVPWRLVFHLLRLRRLSRGATPLEAEAPLRFLLASVLPARRIEICTTVDLDRPGVIGFFAPRILIPEWLYSRLTPGELEQVVLHEARAFAPARRLDESAAENCSRSVSFESGAGLD